MLQLTDRQTGERVWISPQQVSAVVSLKQSDGVGCGLLMAGGFELQVRESAEEVSTKIHKVLNAY
jgi:hypothetical protein